jgi:hypothetical protein
VPVTFDITHDDSTRGWVNEFLGGDKAAAPPPGVCAFTQLPGETVYVPESFLHATMNEGPFTLGVGAQPWDTSPVRTGWKLKHDMLVRQVQVRINECDAVGQSGGGRTGLRTKSCAHVAAPAIRDECARLAERALAEFPECPQLALDEARRLYWMEDDVAGGLVQVERSIALNSLSIDATLLRAQLLYAAGDKKAADEAALEMVRKWRNAWRKKVEPYTGFNVQVHAIMSKKAQKKWKRERYGQSSGD